VFTDILRGVREAKAKVEERLTEQERVKEIHLQVSTVHQVHTG
jgi:hypothetical protein